MVCDERELRRESQTVIESARMRVIRWRVRTVADFVKQRIVSIRAIEEEEEEEEEDC